jgi:hypothetical protein
VSTKAIGEKEKPMDRITKDKLAKAASQLRALASTLEEIANVAAIAPEAAIHGGESYPPGPATAAEIPLMPPVARTRQEREARVNVLTSRPIRGTYDTFDRRR